MHWSSLHVSYVKYCLALEQIGDNNNNNNNNALVQFRCILWKILFSFWNKLVVIVIIIIMHWSSLDVSYRKYCLASGTNW